MVGDLFRSICHNFGLNNCPSVTWLWLDHSPSILACVNDLILRRTNVRINEVPSTRNFVPCEPPAIATEELQSRVKCSKKLLNSFRLHAVRVSRIPDIHLFEMLLDHLIKLLLLELIILISHIVRVTPIIPAIKWIGHVDFLHDWGSVLFLSWLLRKKWFVDFHFYIILIFDFEAESATLIITLRIIDIFNL